MKSGIVLTFLLTANLVTSIAAAEEMEQQTVEPMVSKDADGIDVLSDEAVVERIDYLQQGFDDAELSGRLWAFAWVSVYAGLTGYNMFGIANGSREWDVDLTYFAVGAVKSGLALSLLLISPFYPAYSGTRYARIPDGNPDERKQKLKKGEELLAKGNKKVLGDRTFFKHALKIGVNLVGGAVIWGVEGKDGWKHALLSTGVGIALALGTIWTMPTKAVKQFDSYHEKYGVRQASANNSIRFYFAGYHEGLIAGVVF